MSLTSPAPKNKELKGRNLFWTVFLLVLAVHFSLILAFFVIHSLKKTNQPKISYFNIESSSLTHSTHGPSKDFPLTEKPKGSKNEEHPKHSSPSRPKDIHSPPLAETAEKSISNKPVTKKTALQKESRKDPSKLQKQHTVIPNLREVSRTIPENPQAPSVEGKEAREAQNQGLSPSYYYALIREKLYSLWDQPVDLLGLGLLAVVEITVDDDGGIAQYKLLQSSGNEKFDQSTLLAVERLGNIGERRPSDVPKVITVKFQMEK
ncbi:energy transducer TonB [Candidatus Methylacidiphilum infernorum]|uniref:Periplasmic protein TonB n=1 Tax=Methylacidiphilum infernorum (isolate V4) TaxID=481448 RepID=B3E127_METI4|nr:energy transducer TonB [Candidatus Methylacidiphilum infernorum]ACD84504.1 Periplasmic protein TonB [Methylacidiphilum infernorum V4]